jgi:hypothetical protein
VVPKRIGLRERVVSRHDRYGVALRRGRTLTCEKVKNVMFRRIRGQECPRGAAEIGRRV